MGFQGIEIPRGFEGARAPRNGLAADLTVWRPFSVIVFVLVLENLSNIFEAWNVD